MAARKTEEQKDHAIRMYLAGMTMKEAGEASGISEDHVYRLLELAGVKRRKHYPFDGSKPERVCKTCKKVKPTSYFYLHKKSGNWRGDCKACANEKRIKWFAENPEAKELAKKKSQARDKANAETIYYKYIAKQYGLTKDDYQRLISRCSGLCEICRCPPVTKVRLVIDHDHATGKVRGLLCDKCNTAIGKLGDSTGSLFAAIDYLCRHDSTVAVQSLVNANHI